MSESSRSAEQSRQTVEVSSELFREVYDSPNSLPGAERYVTPRDDVRKIEKLLGMASGSIGAPLWVSGDDLQCQGCGRAPNWLDIVSSAATTVHSAQMIARVILGDRKYVNLEVPHAIKGVSCVECGATISGLRSFKCHNWAYAFGDLEREIERVGRDFRPTTGDQATKADASRTAARGGRPGYAGAEAPTVADSRHAAAVVGHETSATTAGESDESVPRKRPRRVDEEA
jgi:hypothetical protein